MRELVGAVMAQEGGTIKAMRSIRERLREHLDLTSHERLFLRAMFQYDMTSMRSGHCPAFAWRRRRRGAYYSLLDRLMESFKDAGVLLAMRGSIGTADPQMTLSIGSAAMSVAVTKIQCVKQLDAERSGCYASHNGSTAFGVIQESFARLKKDWRPGSAQSIQPRWSQMSCWRRTRSAGTATSPTPSGSTASPRSFRSVGASRPRCAGGTPRKMQRRLRIRTPPSIRPEAHVPMTDSHDEKPPDEHRLMALLALRSQEPQERKELPDELLRELGRTKRTLRKWNCSMRTWMPICKAFEAFLRQHRHASPVPEASGAPACRATGSANAMARMAERTARRAAAVRSGLRRGGCMCGVRGADFGQRQLAGRVSNR